MLISNCSSKQFLIGCEKADRTRDAGIVHQCVDAAQEFGRLLDDPKASFDLTQITADGKSAGTKRFAFRNGSFRSFAAAGIVHCNVISGAGEFDRDTLSNSQSCSGYDDPPPICAFRDVGHRFIRAPLLTVLRSGQYSKIIPEAMEFRALLSVAMCEEALAILLAGCRSGLPDTAVGPSSSVDRASAF